MCVYIYIYVVLISDYPSSIREDNGYVRQLFYVSKDSAAFKFLRNVGTCLPEYTTIHHTML
jgi:hypothetical protein